MYDLGSGHREAGTKIMGCWEGRKGAWARRRLGLDSWINKKDLDGTRPDRVWDWASGRLGLGQREARTGPEGSWDWSIGRLGLGQREPGTGPNED